MRKTLAVLICLMAFAVTASADLVPVDSINQVYKTTTGGQTLYWYLKYDLTCNKTLDEQMALAAGLNLGIGADDWHVAEADEVDELLGTAHTVLADQQAQATLLANTLLGLGYSQGSSTYTGKFSGRYDKPAYAGYYYIGQIGPVIGNPTVFSPSTNATDMFAVPAGPTGKNAELGAWIVATPEPTTICLLGLGGLLIRRRKKA